MRPLRILAAFMILAGVALLIYGVAMGEMRVALVLIVPVVFGSSIIGILAIGLIFAGVFISIADPVLGASIQRSQDTPSDEERSSQTKKNTEFGGVVLIGPIPIMFGSSKKMTIFAVIIAVIVLVLMVLSLFFIRG